MNGYNFTDRVRKVLQMAREEAARLHHEYVGTEHLLLGVLREGKGIGAQVLTDAGVTLERAREEVLRLLVREMPQGGPPKAIPPRPPYTPAGRGSLELAYQEARDLGVTSLGPEL